MKNELIFIGFLVCLFNSRYSFSQIMGCTDPLALNYSESAELNDGSCNYPNTTLIPDLIGILDEQLMETSGLLNWNQWLWTHNDNTDNQLYGLNPLTGEIEQSHVLFDLVNHDWEEITQDENYLYIGDFGNNVSGNRMDLKIIRIDKIALENGVIEADTIAYSYSDQVDYSFLGVNTTDFDCEAMLVTSDSIYLFTKQWQRKKSFLYSLPKLPGTYSAQLLDSLNIEGLVTGATFDIEQEKILLTGYSTFLQPFIFLLYDYPVNHFFNGNKRKINLDLNFHQIESIATIDGITYYLSNEAFSQGPINVDPQLFKVNLSEYLSASQNLLVINGSTPISFQIYPNPAEERLIVKLDPFELPVMIELKNSIGEIVKWEMLTESEREINLSGIESGIYFVVCQDRREKVFIR